MHTHSRVYIHTRISKLYTIFNTLYYYLISFVSLLSILPRRPVLPRISSASRRRSFVFLTLVFPHTPSARRCRAWRTDASRLPSTNRSCAFAVLNRRESRGLRLRAACLYVNRLFTFTDSALSPSFFLFIFFSSPPVSPCSFHREIFFKIPCNYIYIYFFLGDIYQNDSIVRKIS